MELAPSTWAGFPWRKLGASSDVMVLMDYWSYRDCKSVPDHCAGPYTAKNVKRTRSLTKRPVHAIGGVGGRVSAREVKAFVRAAKTTNALGASLYDFRTTHASYWRYLGKLAI